MKIKSIHFFIFILSCILSIQCGMSQNNIHTKFGGEAGIVFSQFPQKNIYVNSRGDITTSNLTPIYSPLIGFHSYLNVRKYMIFSVALQYEKTGYRYYSHKDGIDPFYSNTYTDDEWTIQEFNKICSPIGIGTKFSIWKILSSINIGYRFNYFIDGKYYNKRSFEHKESSKSFYSEKELNVFKKSEVEIPACKLNNQFFYNISLGHKQFELSISYYRSRRHLVYAEFKPPGFCATGYFNSFRNNEYSVSLKYTLN